MLYNYKYVYYSLALPYSCVCSSKIKYHAGIPIQVGFSAVLYTTSTQKSRAHKNHEPKRFPVTILDKHKLITYMVRRIVACLLPLGAVLLIITTLSICRHLLIVSHSHFTGNHHSVNVATTASISRKKSGTCCILLYHWCFLKYELTLWTIHRHAFPILWQTNKPSCSRMSVTVGATIERKCQKVSELCIIAVTMFENRCETNSSFCHQNTDTCWQCSRATEKAVGATTIYRRPPWWQLCCCICCITLIARRGPSSQLLESDGHICTHKMYPVLEYNKVNYSIAKDWTWKLKEVVATNNKIENWKSFKMFPEKLDWKMFP